MDSIYFLHLSRFKALSGLITYSNSVVYGNEDDHEFLTFDIYVTTRRKWLTRGPVKAILKLFFRDYGPYRLTKCVLIDG